MYRYKNKIVFLYSSEEGNILYSRKVDIIIYKKIVKNGVKKYIYIFINIFT